MGRWSDYVPPGERVADIGEAGIFFGAQVSWDGERDHTMGVQDPRTGLWSLGSHRRHDHCPHCGNDPSKGVYCERCASVNSADESKLAAQRLTDRAKEEAKERERREKARAERVAAMIRRAEKKGSAARP